MCKYFEIILKVIIAVTMSSLSFAQTEQKSELVNKLVQEIESGKITFKLTEAQEIIDLLGNPESENTFPDGGMLIQQLKYTEIEIILGKFKRDENAPFILLAVSINNRPIDIGRNKKLVLRSNNDLSKLDNFFGFQNVSLVNTDLKNENELIQTKSFDNLTEWPSKDKLPLNFDPAAILENHKTPGLGIKKLHSQDVTGKGVGIAIIDQPLLLGHEEYTSQIIRYDATGLSDYPPQMHGSPVASIAVGKNIGVAPEAALSYFAVPMWQKDNSHYIKTFKKIFHLNESLPAIEKIKVISISDGSFSSNSNYESWRKILKEADEKGIFVITCDTHLLNYGTLQTKLGQIPDSAASYTVGKYSSENNVIRIPAGNRTLASFRGNAVYTFDREGGMSWAAPYIAGLAALAFQVNPEITPNKIKELLIETVTRTSAGPIVNPTGFIERIKNDKAHN